MIKLAALLAITLLGQSLQQTRMPIHQGEAAMLAHIANKYKPFALTNGTGVSYVPQATRDGALVSLYKGRFAGVFAEKLDGPYSYGNLYICEINAVSGQVVKDIPAGGSGKPKVEHPVPKVIEDHYRGLAFSRDQWFTFRKGGITDVKELAEPPQEEGLRPVALIGTELILVPRWDMERKKLYIRFGKFWYELVPNREVADALARLR